MNAAPQLEPSDVDIRVGLADDAASIAKAWLSTQRHVYPNSYALNWQEKTTRAIEACLERSTVLVAHLVDDPGAMVSFLVSHMFGRVFVVDFAYTEESARRRGIVRRMMELANPNAAPVVFTHAPRNENALRHLVTKCIFDPSMWQR